MISLFFVFFIFLYSQILHFPIAHLPPVPFFFPSFALVDYFTVAFPLAFAIFFYLLFQASFSNPSCCFLLLSNAPAVLSTPSSFPPPASPTHLYLKAFFLLFGRAIQSCSRSSPQFILLLGAFRIPAAPRAFLLLLFSCPRPHLLLWVLPIVSALFPLPRKPRIRPPSPFQHS